ncbi:Mur ligase family protein [Mycetocola zhadangensis]|uniref:Mur ligase family protein n=1 Tax=Mycetocola zhadangensis TaxID=1164595 RepID=UPI00198F94D3|nr:UDP-N-acetylmuramoyl-L-alanyl-D-glutamate--2,6-diaminopimelate ligase [Mycetocola zhadangensis]GGF02132.1 UDP-N-acetylmuramoyl-L-alanyl-D-glutamate--2,6-diaminopimelate ligase [Mycetocola zhadangensis]
MRPSSPSPTRLIDLAEHFNLALHSETPNVLLTGITMNSRDVEPGDLYLGLPGARFHGATFSKDAVARGAVAILTDASGAVDATAAGVPVLLTPNSPRDIAGHLAAWIYGTVTGGPLTLGVTGTNGKTSTVHFLDALLTQLGRKTGLSSTAQRRIGAEVVVSSLTTPEAPELHGLLARMHEAGVDAALLEVSAHALTRHRVDGVMFHVAAFTNLSHDHLDDYADMDEYFEAKLQLFTPEHSRKAVVSLDTPAGFAVVDRAGVDVVTISSTPGVASDWVVTVADEQPDSTAFTLSSAHGTVSTRVPVIGRHMAANGGLAIAMLVEAGIDFGEIRAVLDRDGAITASLPGRAVHVPVTDGPNVYVDSGHSPDAFAKTLESVRSLTRGRVIMIAGANGDRDALKRPEMGREAALGSDVLIITDHQPRSEDPALIREAVLAGARKAKPEGDIREIAAPEAAIRAAVAEATPTDTILWAGLAEKEYREVAGVKIPFSVLGETRAALAEAGWVSA